MKFDLKEMQAIFKKIGVKDLRKAMSIVRMKTKGKLDKFTAGSIMFKLCNDCRCKIIAESMHSTGQPLDETQLCDKCRPKWKEHIEKYKPKKRL